MSRPHIVIASRIFTPEGGAAAYRLGALADGLETDDFTLTVVTSRPPRELADATETASSSRRVRRWPVLRDRTGSVRGYVQYLSFDIPLLFRLWAPRRIAAIVVEPPPTTGVMVRIVARLRRVPYVYYAADVTSSAAAGIGVNPAIVSVLRRVEGWVLRGAARVLAVSDGVADEVIALGVDRRRVAVVGTGVDTATFAPAGTDAVTVVDDAAAQTFVYAGTMSEIQGAGIFVDAFAEIADEYPHARLLMLGTGTERDELIARAQRNPGSERTSFPGSRPGSVVASAMRTAAAGLASVRPERGYDFAFATKTFVSGACGAPVIYAGVGPAGDRVREHRLGESVDWDAHEVADAMRRVLDTPASAENRARIAAWVDANHSLRAVSEIAITSIRSICR